MRSRFVAKEEGRMRRSRERSGIEKQVSQFYIFFYLKMFDIHNVCLSSRPMEHRVWNKFYLKMLTDFDVLELEGWLLELFGITLLPPPNKRGVYSWLFFDISKTARTILLEFSDIQYTTKWTQWMAFPGKLKGQEKFIFRNFDFNISLLLMVLEWC